jgi:hypothetical protein
MPLSHLICSEHLRRVAEGCEHILSRDRVLVSHLFDAEAGGHLADDGRDGR